MTMQAFNGFSLVAAKDITKGDIVTMCEFASVLYGGRCRFRPEGISKGGIVFEYDDGAPEWYKSVRLGIGRSDSHSRWPWLPKNVMAEWRDNEDVILERKEKITIFLKAYHGAPLFTMAELKTWDTAFCRIGLLRKGKLCRGSLECN